MFNLGSQQTPVPPQAPAAPPNPPMFGQNAQKASGSKATSAQQNPGTFLGEGLQQQANTGKATLLGGTA